MSKADFFTYHRSTAGKIIFYYAGNMCIMTARQFRQLSNTIICISGTDYSVSVDTVTKL